MTIRVSGHAIQRYQERVANVPDEAVVAALTSSCIEVAVEFGAKFVKLPGKQHVVLEGDVVVTVQPADIAPAALGQDRDERFRRE